MKTQWTAVDVALLNSSETRVMGTANISFSTNDPSQFPKFLHVDGHTFERAKDGIAQPVVRYKHWTGCDCPKMTASKGAK